MLTDIKKQSYEPPMPGGAVPRAARLSVSPKPIVDKSELYTPLRAMRKDQSSSTTDGKSVQYLGRRIVLENPNLRKIINRLTGEKSPP